ncbi:hypothetical protein [Flavobacterium cupreum]|nr:hypothetical protein [Flavobacterium cupreum]
MKIDSFELILRNFAKQSRFAVAELPQLFLFNLEESMRVPFKKKQIHQSLCKKDSGIKKGELHRFRKQHNIFLKVKS